MAILLGFEVGGSNPNLPILPLLLAHHHFLLFVVLDLPYFVCQDLHLLQSEVNLFGKLVIKVLVDGCFLVIEDGFEGFLQFDGRALRKGPFLALD